MCVFVIGCVSVCGFVSEYVCVCERERNRERASVCVCVCVSWKCHTQLGLDGNFSRALAWFHSYLGVVVLHFKASTACVCVSECVCAVFVGVCESM